MTMYRVTTTLSQRQLVDYLDANSAVDAKIEVVNDDAPPAIPATAIYQPARAKRKRRTKAEMEAATAQAA